MTNSSREKHIIGTVNDELKNIVQVEHSWHRIFDDFIVVLLSAIAVSKRSCVIMLQERLTHSLLCFEFVELMLNMIT